MTIKITKKMVEQEEHICDICDFRTTKWDEHVTRCHICNRDFCHDCGREIEVYIDFQHMGCHGYNHPLTIYICKECKETFNVKFLQVSLNAKDLQIIEKDEEN